jgi:hypothetical protein
MFTTLTIALGFGLYQMAKVNEQLPEDESHLLPERSLQRMDVARDEDRIRGTKKDPLKA